MAFFKNFFVYLHSETYLTDRGEYEYFYLSVMRLTDIINSIRL